MEKIRALRGREAKILGHEDFFESAVTIRCWSIKERPV